MRTELDGSSWTDELIFQCGMLVVYPFVLPGYSDPVHKLPPAFFAVTIRRQYRLFISSAVDEKSRVILKPSRYPAFRARRSAESFRKLLLG